jgi:hypothetical protein
MNAKSSGTQNRSGLLFDCERCGEPIEVAAALLFSPPNEDLVRKHHLCHNCYQEIIHGFQSIGQAGRA